ncbi:bifunctional DNA-formamidopyrimidine glycosylase/DNA-(apurinic or apyrimidinic site) lyase [Citricoccus sp. NR2]|uniref:bifunctional DNA-formamidopyrimidine glycosylase/DNA-(apurinic or apyrimidinic site) lyase n=1 Tax=Citricoccus sp. NR2 TaxID=3004095 RepID=UPI0022DE0153|nr:bifunctional DNA-formamidopyrimidine glycosylase/DNA-(apurinic or apyrimidinic site) lyase [Citricoccus sp. NR2]WBL18570.1 bifunctional DNA-formamidopyrimidine glycosylase/DNA-(apurinic or apyrimidinic site) lyase [Citricoccus sp. NR2]
MPELPEVEVVRRGLQSWAVGRRITDLEILDARTLRRHGQGPQDFIEQVTGACIDSAQRRGKYLWLPMKTGSGEGTAMVVHLGMSGQMLVSRSDIPDQRHLRCRFVLDDGADELRFVDQRIFGGLYVDRLIAVDDAPGETIPSTIVHIGRDPLDRLFSLDEVFAHAQRRRTEIKRILLDQSVAAGIGNIYADEALWRAGLHFATPVNSMSHDEVSAIYAAAHEVMTEALDQGGTSFDSLYVNVNGESGYFARSLNVYGRAGENCRRCNSTIVRSAFMNRSSHYCPVCQPIP